METTLKVIQIYLDTIQIITEKKLDASPIVTALRLKLGELVENDFKSEMVDFAQFMLEETRDIDPFTKVTYEHFERFIKARKEAGNG